MLISYVKKQKEKKKKKNHHFCFLTTKFYEQISFLFPGNDCACLISNHEDF